ncbi:MAG: class I SAM-dependent methyltransferase [Candidatus Omnitrophica bacterium]|nr:class I SAM-dependent methyltransferase [Candidatus Omnitrophota bacterium]
MPESSSNKGLDYSQTKSFWENRYKRKEAAGAWYVANLSDNIPLQAVFKDSIEKEIISGNVSLAEDLDVLDLGCGAGRMSLFFGQRCGKVVGVDFSENLLKMAAENIRPFGLNNISFIQEHAERFLSSDKFDIIFLGGILSYLNDKEAQDALSHAREMLKGSGRLIIRDSLKSRKRRVLQAKYQDNFQDNYSVIYRSIKELDTLVRGYDFRLVFADDLSIFPFMGLYHFIVRKLFRSAQAYSSLSTKYFRLSLRLMPYLKKYRRSFVYKFIAYLANKYEHKLFIYSLNE